MRYSSAHAAKSGSVPFMLRGPKSVRTALAAAVAGAVGLVPIVFMGSPAFAADSNMVVSPSSASVTEGGAVTLTYTPVAGGVYDFTTTGTAVSGTDYTALTSAQQTLTFTGTTPQTLTIQTTDDQLYEIGETIIVRATNHATPSNYTDTTITINDNDVRPSYTLAASPATVTEGVGSKTTVTATLSAASGVDTTVALTTSNGTAVAGVPPLGDYTALTGSSGDTITILAGSLTGTKDILVTNDGVKDTQDTESFTVTGAGTNVLPTAASATVSIKDAQTTPKLTISGGGAVAEGSAATFTVTTDTKSELPITVQWDSVDVTPATGDGKATAGTDFPYPGSRLVTIGAGQTSNTFTITPPVDSLDEPTEDYAIQLSNPTNAALGTTIKAVGTITDSGSDGPPTLTIAPTSVTEGDTGKKTQTFTATLSALSGKTVKANWATANGTALAGKDYVAGSGTLTFAPGTTSQTFTVDIIGDTIDEGSGEGFSIGVTALSSETTPTFGTSYNPTITITDDDAPPTIASFANLSVKEGDDTSVVLLPIKLSNPSTNPISFDVTQVVGTASITIGGVGSNDETLLNTTVTIPPEVTTGYVAVLLNGDKTYEGDETSTFTATAQAGAGGQNYLSSPYTASSVLTIVNDDKAPDLAINDVTGKEGDTVAVTGTVTGVSQSSTTLNVSFAGGSVKGSKAADATDFSNPGVQQVVVAAGTPTGTVVPVGLVPLTTDTTAEPAETIIASGFGVANVGTVTNGTITIAGADGGTTPPTDGAPTIMVTSQITGAVAVSITGKAAAGATVDLWAAPMDDIKLPLEKILTTTANATTGAYSFSRWIGTGYRFQTAVGELKSAEKTVTVVQAPVFVASSPSAGTISLAVQGNPRGADQTVIIQRWVNNAWVNTTWRGMTGPDNLWKATASVPAKSTWTLRAFVAGYTPSGLLPGFSPQKTITIK